MRSFMNGVEKNKSKYQVFISEYNIPEDFKCIWQKEVTKTVSRKPTALVVG